MRNKAVYAFIATILLTTCQMGRSGKGVTAPTQSRPHDAVRSDAMAGKGCTCETVIGLLDDLESCESARPVCGPQEPEDPPEPETVVKTKTVTVAGPPKKCSGGKRPDIVAVPQSECQKDKVCLDDKGQRALAINLAAYEAFVNKVMDCEAGK